MMSSALCIAAALLGPQVPAVSLAAVAAEKARAASDAKPAITDEQKAKVVARLEQIWKSWQNQIQTARLEVLYRVYICLDDKSRPTREQAVDFLDKLHAALERGGFPAVRQLASAFPVTPYETDGGWQRLTILVDGVRVRNTLWSLDGKRLVRDIVFDGDREYQLFADTSQVNVFQGKSHVVKHSLSSFRLARPPEHAAKLAYLRVEGDRARVGARAGSTSLIDLNTGLSLESEGRWRISRRYQPTKYVGGIVFPRLSVDITLSPKGLQSVQLLYLDEAAFNVGLADDAFHASAPAGATIVDYRDSLDKPTTVKTKVAEPNMAAVLERLDADRPGRPPDRPWRLWVIAVNVVVLLLAAMLVYRARRRRRSHSTPS